MKRHRIYRRTHSPEKPIPWLPIDSRLFPKILSFGHVKGIARIFLEIEITISLVMIAGTLAIVVLTMLGLK